MHFRRSRAGLSAPAVAVARWSAARLAVAGLATGLVWLALTLPSPSGATEPLPDDLAQRQFPETRGQVR